MDDQNRDKCTEDELREFAQARLHNLILYRFEWASMPTKPQAVVDLLATGAFFAPRIVWIAGQMYDTFSLGDIQCDRDCRGAGS